MDLAAATRTCPTCDSRDYAFRGRRTVTPEDGRGEAEVETRYKCKACGHEWRVRTPAPRAA